jgi:hypothetical protein
MDLAQEGRIEGDSPLGAFGPAPFYILGRQKHAKVL